MHSTISVAFGYLLPALLILHNGGIVGAAPDRHAVSHDDYGHLLFVEGDQDSNELGGGAGLVQWDTENSRGEVGNVRRTFHWNNGGRYADEMDASLVRNRIGNRHVGIPTNVLTGSSRRSVGNGGFESMNRASLIDGKLHAGPVDVGYGIGVDT